jgi:hemerythrin-like domain-containing protein
MTPASTPATRAAETVAFHDDHLLAHFDVEEHVLFPVLRAAAAHDGTARLLDRLQEEHREMTRLRATVATAAGASLEDVLRRFADLLETHVRAEERELFAGFPGPLPEAEVSALGERIRARRAGRR